MSANLHISSSSTIPPTRPLGHSTKTKNILISLALGIITSCALTCLGFFALEIPLAWSCTIAGAGAVLVSTITYTALVCLGKEEMFKEIFPRQKQNNNIPLDNTPPPMEQVDSPVATKAPLERKKLCRILQGGFRALFDDAEKLLSELKQPGVPSSLEKLSLAARAKTSGNHLTIYYDTLGNLGCKSVQAIEILARYMVLTDKARGYRQGRSSSCIIYFDNLPEGNDSTDGYVISTKENLITLDNDLTDLYQLKPKNLCPEDIQTASLIHKQILCACFNLLREQRPRATPLKIEGITGKTAKHAEKVLNALRQKGCIRAWNLGYSTPTSNDQPYFVSLDGNEDCSTGVYQYEWQ